MRSRALLPLVRSLALVAALAALFMILRSPRAVGGEGKEVPYSQLLAQVRVGAVEHVEVRDDILVAKLKAAPPASESTVVHVARIPNADDSVLLKELDSRGVPFAGKATVTAWWLPVLLSMLPFVIVPVVFWMLAGARRNQPLRFGRSKAKVYDLPPDRRVSFHEVAGVDEAKAELSEVVQFLKQPEKFRVVGARVPKGVLLVGAPGTGKTLLAKAVAGEAGVPFFSLSGSEFVEMFVGVGAARVRDLFEQAKKRAPCIIFIDELDAVGKKRAGPVGFAANEEREQTLNQLLVEIDGFDSAARLIIMAATNSPEILDRALLRAGRFDRQVLVERPDVRGREAILKVHSRKVSVGRDVDFHVIAQRTPGMVGADLANVVNEAALASVRRASVHVDAADFEEAIDRIQLGLKKEGRVMTEEDKRRVAYHESGHALVALAMKHADPVHKVTIIPRSIGSLGATLQLPTDERYLLTRDELRDRICVLLGGRAAEEVAFKEMSTGAQDDIERATELARQMVCRFGMSDRVGPMGYEHHGVAGFDGFYQERVECTPISEATARLVDAETKAIVDEAHERATQVLQSKHDVLEHLAIELRTRETMAREDLDGFLRRVEAGTAEEVQPIPRVSPPIEEGYDFV